MKKLSLLKLQGFKSLKPEDLKRIKGGSCQSWLCQRTLDISLFYLWIG